MSEQDIDFQFFPTQNFDLSLQQDTVIHDQVVEENGSNWQPPHSMHFSYDTENTYQGNHEFIYNHDHGDIPFIDTQQDEEDDNFSFTNQEDFVRSPLGLGCSDDNQVYYEVITKARCIDCDKLVDIKKDKHCPENCTLQKEFSCSMCPERFNVLQNLQVHEIVEHSSQKNFDTGSYCGFCDTSKRKKKSFQRFHAYIAHIRTHVKSDTFICIYCNEEFSYAELYSRHKRIKHSSKLDKEKRGFSKEVGFCARCNKLIEMEKVDSHRLIHSLHVKIDKKRDRLDVKQSKTSSSSNVAKCVYKCASCDKSFRRPSELKRHLAVHERTSNWPCLICDKKFSHESGLLSHKRLVHSSNSKSHACKICGQSFSKPCNLERHVKRVHPLDSNRVLFDCPFCPCQFSNQATLRRHSTKVHGEKTGATLSCDLCHRVFQKKSTLKRHRNAHLSDDLDKPFKCNRCSKRLKYRSSLRLHMDVHARKDVDDPVLTHPKCTICLKHLSSQSNLRKHMLIHESSYGCNDCCQRFSTIHKLDRHRCTRTGNESDMVSVIDISGSSGNRKNNDSVSFLRKSYVCNFGQCTASFVSFKVYKEHKAWHQGLKPHTCWTCRKSFRTFDLLKSHKEIHSRVPIECDYCGMVLAGRIQYGHHVRIYHRNAQLIVESPIRFDVPDRTVANCSALSYPVTEFTGRELAEGLFINRAQSAEPGQPTSFSASLDPPIEPTVDMEDDHQELIEETTSDRPTRCPVCLHHYDNIAHLTIHLYYMATESQHSITVMHCPLCQCSLRGAGEAAHHIRISHPYVRSPIGIQQTFPNYLPVIKPTASAFDKKHSCPHCPSSFLRKSDLERHIRVHTGERPYQCDLCERAFSVRSTLIAHKKTHERGLPQEKCSICDLKFYTKNALTLHLRIHSGEKPLQCRFCEESFRTSAARQSHESNQHEDHSSKHVCSKPGCRNCVQKKKRIRTQQSLSTSFCSMNSTDAADNEVALLKPAIEGIDNKNLSSASVLYPVKSYSVNLVKDNQKSLVDTLAQFSRVEAGPLLSTKESAFTPAAQQNIGSIETDFTIHITAKRISITEYSVKFSREPQAIREGVDTTSSILLSNLTDLAAQNYNMRIVLMDNQLLNINPKTTLIALEKSDTGSVLFTARPYDQYNQECVALLPPKPNDFCRRCDICEVDLPTLEISDSHFASEDHEVAQTARSLHPIANSMVSLEVNPCLPAAPPRGLTDYTCKLCGRKFLDLDPLVAHIRREHERDHPNTFPPRLAVRTAPPLEGDRFDGTQ